MKENNQLDLKPREACRWDLVSLGEVMLRLDPGDDRVATTRQFRAWEGGGEYNVARGLRRCFNLRTSIVTALADNPVGRLIEDMMLQGGVDLSHVLWMPYDGVGRTVRNGLNFTERGFGVRAALGCSDRGHTAAIAIEAWNDRLGEKFSAMRGRDGSIRAASSAHYQKPRHWWPEKRWMQRIATARSFLTI